MLPCLLWATTTVGCRSELLGRVASAPASELATVLTGRLAEGGLDAEEAREIALERARFELGSASGEDGKLTLEALLPCATALGGAWLRRASLPDEAAAHAALLATAAGLAEPLRYGRFVTDERPAWRAAGARSLGLPQPYEREPDEHARGRREVMLARTGWWRRHLMLDPYREVRRAALLAAGDAAAPSDVDAVLDAARRDPDAELRRVAIAAAGKIGTRAALLGLIDLWSAADEDARVSLVAALGDAMAQDAASPGARDVAEGALADAQPRKLAERQLWRIAELDLGLPSLRAALALLATDRPGADATALGIATGVIERAIDEAATRVRLAAINDAPVRAAAGQGGMPQPSPAGAAELLEAIVLASKSDEPRVAVAALARRLELGPKEREAALAALRDRSRGVGLSVEAAIAARASARDATVLAALDELAAGPSAITRGEAGAYFAALGRFDKAALLLADPSPAVRAKTACALLRAQSE